MKPKWRPIALAGEFTPYGEIAFQPYLHTDKAVVVTGGPAALFLVKTSQNPHLQCNVPAQVRITGFAVHASEVYVQDGPVLSRWDLTKGHCSAAINLLNPKLSWQRDDGPVDWAKLHVLNDQQRGKQLSLKRARRRTEWLTLLESSEALQRDTSAARTPAEETKLRAMIAELAQLVGPNRDQVRTDLAAAEQAAAQLIFSAPVVRKHQVGAKEGALVYVIGRDGTLHPIDENLQHMGTVRLDTSARPALALAEWETASRSDDFACRLHYVTGDGLVRAIDGNSLPPKSAGEWPARGRASLQAGIRPRVDSGLVWGNDAQESGVFALPINQPGAASQIKVPASEEWRWLELPKVGSLALVCTDTASRLISFAPGSMSTERWGARAGATPRYSSFLETTGDPLLVAEFDREPQGQNTGLAFRILVANTVDTLDDRCTKWYPPPPETIKTGTLEAFASQDSAPISIRTQVTVSRTDAYLVARDRTAQGQLRALLADGAGSWQAHREKIMAPYADAAAASAAIGDLALPPMAGSHALYCYVVGDAVTSVEVAAARKVLDRMRELVVPVMVRINYSVSKEAWGGVHIHVSSGALSKTRVSLRFSDGETIGAETDANGDVGIPASKLGQSVTASAFGWTIGAAATSSTCQLQGRTGNTIHLSQHETLDSGGGGINPIFPRKR